MVNSSSKVTAILLTARTREARTLDKHLQHLMLDLNNLVPVITDLQAVILTILNTADHNINTANPDPGMDRARQINMAANPHTHHRATGSSRLVA